MSWWRKVWDTVTETVTKPFKPTPRPRATPRAPSGTRQRRAPRASSAPRQSANPESQLPPGWEIAGLWDGMNPPKRIHATNATQVTNSQIDRASAIVIHYIPAGEDGYRWVHGAQDWDGLRDYIDDVIADVSPT